MISQELQVGSTVFLNLESRTQVRHSSGLVIVKYTFHGIVKQIEPTRFMVELAGYYPNVWCDIQALGNVIKLDTSRSLR